MNSEVFKEKKRLDDIFKLIDKISDEETKAHFSRYLCVLVSGFIENSMKYLICEYARSSASPKIVNYIQAKADSMTNLNCEKVKQILCLFSKTWLELFEDKIGESEKDALDSVIANRNSIVHGKSVGLTFARIKDYYEKVKAIIDYIDNSCIQ